jgi:hypothetical protein
MVTASAGLGVPGPGGTFSTRQAGGIAEGVIRVFAGVALALLGGVAGLPQDTASRAIKSIRLFFRIFGQALR